MIVQQKENQINETCIIPLYFITKIDFFLNQNPNDETQTTLNYLAYLILVDNLDLRHLMTSWTGLILTNHYLYHLISSDFTSKINLIGNR